MTHLSSELPVLHYSTLQGFSPASSPFCSLLPPLSTSQGLLAFSPPQQWSEQGAQNYTSSEGTVHPHRKEVFLAPQTGILDIFPPQRNVV